MKRLLLAGLFCRLLFVALCCWAILLAGRAVASSQSAEVGWGFDLGGAIGSGFASSSPLLTPIPVFGAQAKELVAGGSAYILTASGTVEGAGGNSEGQLGDGTRARKLSPVRVGALTGVVQIAAAGEHGIALLANGTVATWGNNIYGQLGTGKLGEPSGEACARNCRSVVPVPVPGISGASAVFAGGATDAVLLNTGAVVAWGENKQGVIDSTKLNKASPTLVRGLTNVRTLALGGQATLGGHLLALLNDGTLLAQGYNGQGQLGVGSTVSSSFPVKVPVLGATAIEASWTHSLVLAGGKLLAFGNNDAGELGLHTATLCGRKTCSTTPVVVPLAGVTSFDAGYGSSYAVAGGQGLSWGVNKYGQLGNGTRTNRGAPGPIVGLTGVTKVQAGGEYTAFATLTGPVPAPVVGLTSGSHSLTAHWTGSGAQGWYVAWRVFGRGVFTRVVLPASARAYAITGLESRSYEVAVQQKLGGSFGRDLLEGVAGG